MPVRGGGEVAVGGVRRWLSATGGRRLGVAALDLRSSDPRFLRWGARGMGRALEQLMPGGPKRLDGRDYEPEPKPLRVVELSEAEKSWDTAMFVLRQGRQFQKCAMRVAKASGISLAGLQVLDVTERLTLLKDDPVSELEVVRGTGLAKSTVSNLMGRFMVQGLVDIGPDAWGISYRIWLTEAGERLVVKLRGELVDAVRGLALAERLPKGRDDFRVNRG